MGVVEAARAFAAVEVLFGQSLAICPDTLQKRQRFLSRWCCLSCGVSLPSFPSLEDRSGFDFLDSEVLPLLEVKPEDEFESFCLDLEEPLPFSVLELLDLFSDLFLEVLEEFSWEISALHSQ